MWSKLWTRVLSLTKDQEWFINKEVNKQIEDIEESMLHLPQIDCPITHRFAPGVYIREMRVPAGILIIGHEHRTEHFNILIQGKIRQMMGGLTTVIEAPCTFISKPFSKKMGLVLEDVVYQTIHATNCRDIDKLESMLFLKTKAYLAAEKFYENFQDERLEELSKI